MNINCKFPNGNNKNKVIYFILYNYSTLFYAVLFGYFLQYIFTSFFYCLRFAIHGLLLTWSMDLTTKLEQDYFNVDLSGYTNRTKNQHCKPLINAF